MHKLALVTGCSKRIGREVSLRLASLGYSLILHYNTDRKGVDNLKQDLVETYENLQFYEFQGDLRCPRFVEDLSQFCSNNCLIVNLLIHNASIFNKDDFSTLSYESLQNNYSIHLFQPLLITKWFCGQVVEGQVITIVDQAVTRNDSGYWSYILSKKSLLDATKMMALELAPNFRVNAILPGMILPSVHGSSDQFKNEVLYTPLQISPGIVSILSTLTYFIENRWCTGQIIYCNGGEHLN
ncbi:SDR family NAD(P)-dependent oxidoreductase [Halosquirtibacter laminarini]|uniref:SDR family NAD(P)-dependent oxidoreductase n=1 Tax=Halosquirtibacter laminarini TaxID=3374600 RepID=A0AC61NEI4_9BACT|nr:SDR family NAD(P)-dependent oxidoreductase [Prolixibacteraceae bacterium]